MRRPTMYAAGKIRPQPVTETIEVEIKAGPGLSYIRRLFRAITRPTETADEYVDRRFATRRPS